MQFIHVSYIIVSGCSVLYFILTNNVIIYYNNAFDTYMMFLRLILFQITDVGSTICSFDDCNPLSLTVAVVDHSQQLLNSVCEHSLLSL